MVSGKKGESYGDEGVRSIVSLLFEPSSRISSNNKLSQLIVDKYCDSERHRNKPASNALKKMTVNIQDSNWQQLT